MVDGLARLWHDAIIGGDDPYDVHITQVFKEGIAKLGWNVTFQGSVTPEQVVDWGPILSQIRQNPPAVRGPRSPRTADVTADPDDDPQPP